MTKQSLIEAACVGRIVSVPNSKPGILTDLATLMESRSQLIDAYNEKFGECIRSQTMHLILQ